MYLLSPLYKITSFSSSTSTTMVAHCTSSPPRVPYESNPSYALCYATVSPLCVLRCFFNQLNHLTSRHGKIWEGFFFQYPHSLHLLFYFLSPLSYASVLNKYYICMHMQRAWNFWSRGMGTGVGILIWRTTWSCGLNSLRRWNRSIRHFQYSLPISLCLLYSP